MAAKLRKKGEVGKKAAFYSRTKALRVLQIGLKEFRTLCIYKGIYPQLSGTKAKYHKKDISFLSRDPIIKYFRDSKVFKSKLKKQVFKQNKTKVMAAKFNRPKIELNHIIKERYPTFDGALGDLGDALNLLSLFAKLPIIREIRRDIVRTCKLRIAEFFHYIMMSGSLRKAFVSVKGIYYQADINGHTVVWLVPHPNLIDIPTGADIGVMVNFVEIYLKLMEFVNFKLFKDIKVTYPLKLNMKQKSKSEAAGRMNQEEAYLEMLSCLNVEIKESPKINSTAKTTTEEVEISEEFAHLIDQTKTDETPQVFAGKKFFISREVNKEAMVFLIRAFGGKVSCDDPHAWGGYDENDVSINYQIADRDQVTNFYPSRFYVQPQWVFDSVNNKQLLPVNSYVPGVVPPPHLSPFDETYMAAIKEAKEEVSASKQLELESSDDVEAGVVLAGEDSKAPLKEKKAPLTPAERKLALMKMSKKKRKLYDVATSKLSKVKSKKDKIKKKHLMIENYPKSKK